ncbi:MAG: hypothetical protein NW215_04500 [Hyphomicrobiales bacterium]|nr:hypothetical protein [Hyphomicrobiales bacterium]
MTLDEFLQGLAHHGARLDDWPPGLKEAAQAAVSRDAALAAALAREARFEEALRGRFYEPPSPDFALRVVQAAASRSPSAFDEIALLFQRIVAEVTPRPALSFGLLLALGAILGAYASAAVNGNGAERDVLNALFSLERSTL